MNREEQIMNDPTLAPYVDKQRGWINEAFMDGVRWADEHPEDTTDWNQVRIQAAIAAMQGIMSDVDNFTTNQTPNGVAKLSVNFADALVKELKGEPLESL